MATVCIQCALKAILAGEPSPVFDETIEEHIARVHPHPVAALAERRELERLLKEKMFSGKEGKGKGKGKEDKSDG